LLSAVLTGARGRSTKMLNFNDEPEEDKRRLEVR
jgi:hypothetical protein